MKLKKILDEIRELKTLAKNIRESHARVTYNDYLIRSVFNGAINENDNSDIIRLLVNDEIEEVTPDEFAESLSTSKHPQMLTHYTKSELSKMRLFKVPGFNIGYALKRSEQTGKHDEVVAVHNNSEVGGIGTALMKNAIRHGACYLDHFDVPQLSGLYSSLGFEEYDRSDFDPKYMDDDSFEKKYGKAAVIFRVHKNCRK